MATTKPATMTVRAVNPFNGRPLGPARTIAVNRPVSSEPRPERRDETPAPTLSAPAAEILGWVGTDPDRARLALAREVAGANPRQRLSARLGEIAAPVPAPELDSGYDAERDRGDEPSEAELVGATDNSPNPEAP